MKARLVIDTNVVVSAQLNPHGNEAVVLALALNPEGPFAWHATGAILAGYTRVLHYKKFPLSSANVSRILTLIHHRVTIARPSFVISECTHEPDNRFLECAEDCKADYIVTGNTKHFPKQWKTTKLLNARELLEKSI